MKKAKENWIGEQCSAIEENLMKNNSKRADHLVKDLTTVKQGKATTVQDRSEKCLTDLRTTDTEPIDRSNFKSYSITMHKIVLTSSAMWLFDVIKNMSSVVPVKKKDPKAKQFRFYVK